MNLPKAEAERMLRNYTDVLHTMCRYELALHTIANMPGDSLEAARAVAQEALERERRGASGDP